MSTITKPKRHRHDTTDEQNYISLPVIEQDVRRLLGEESVQDSDPTDTDEWTAITYSLNFIYKQLNNNVEAGPTIEDNLGDCFNSIWSKPLNKDRYLTKLKQLRIPSNVNIQVKKCNKEVWKTKLGTKTKTHDLKLQKIQTSQKLVQQSLISFLAHKIYQHN